MKLKNFKYYKLCIVFLAMFMLFPAKVYAVSIPQPTQEFYVNDFADVLTDEEEKQMLDKAVNLASEELGIQVVVTTIKSLEGESIENYAHDMYSQYRIGKDDMGVLILLSTEDRDTRIEVGTAIEAYITDSKAGRLLDKHAIPHFKENKFNSGLVEVQSAVIDEASTVKTQMLERAEREAKMKEDMEKLGNFFGSLLKGIGKILLIGIPIGLIIWLVYKAIEKYLEKEDELNSLREYKFESENKIRNAKNRAEQVEMEAEREQLQMRTELNDLQERYDELDKRLNDARKLYPSLDDDIDKSHAESFNKELTSFVNKKPSSSIIPTLAGVLATYKGLTSNQKRFVSDDIETVKDTYQKSLDIKQEEERKSKNSAILATLLGIVGAISIGKSSNLSRLNEAMSLYNKLDPDYKSEFGSSKLALLKKLLNQAEDDDERERRRRQEEEERRRREEEEEEERRRIQRMNSSSSFSSSSSFHGFGGRSSGGGASRHF